MRAHALAVGVASATLALSGTMLGLPTAADASSATSRAQPDARVEAWSGQYVVLYKQGASAAAREAVRNAGGTIVDENAAIGTALVRAPGAEFAAKAKAAPPVAGIARNAAVGTLPRTSRGAHPPRRVTERLTAAERAAAAGASRQRSGAAQGTDRSRRGGPSRAEPLAFRQWDMRQMGTTRDGSYSGERGDDRVRVGVMDTGIDGDHPDIAPNFNRRLSRNFTTDMPKLDGPCEHEGCTDPADVDNSGHGTHVASTIAAPLNGLGVGGVAPETTLVNIRAGQDSGYFFLHPTLHALTYAGDTGIDVVNMSFYVDPWLFNCRSNPADSPAAGRDQRTIIAAVQRAVTYAREHGVTLVSAAGNSGVNLGDPKVDNSSPNYPPGKAYHREISNACLTVPAETRGVIAVSATGPSERKAHYSNYGTEQIEVAAPGGDAYDSADHRPRVENLVLGAYPEKVARANGHIDKRGNPTTPFVVKSCRDTTCAYYQYLQGTSMASPHAAGVAALLVSRLGHPDPNGPGLTMNPATVRRLLQATAAERACPSPRDNEYVRQTPDGTRTVTHHCSGSPGDNGFYGKGILDAAAAAGVPGRP